MTALPVIFQRSAVQGLDLESNAEADKIAVITGYVSTHGCDLPLKSQVCACDTTTTATTIVPPPIRDEYNCINGVNWMPGNLSKFY